MLSEHYFGDVEAVDEGKNHPEYFHATFVLPSSFSLNALNNNRKYIIVGKKGVGKTAVTFSFARQLESQGFLTHFFSFYNDLKPRDYNEAAATQKIDMLNVANLQNIFLNYDFRLVWKRTFLVKFAESLKENGFESKFTRFVIGERGRLSSIFEGLLKSASLKLSAEMSGIGAEIGLDLSAFGAELPLDKFVAVALELLHRHHTVNRFYLFVDELVFSKLDAKNDEVRVRAAMVRDIFRVAREMNNYFVTMHMDFHIVCAVRPEIRDLINDMDAEIGKVFDGKSVTLAWDMGDEDESLLFRLFKLKVIHSKQPRNVEFESFFCSAISFGQKTISLEDFVKTNTWSRPRDAVQLLNAIADRSPNAQSIGENELKIALNEYGRRSFVEIVDEISVRHGPMIAQLLRSNVQKPRYDSFESFYTAVLSKAAGLDQDALVTDLFNFGVVGNFKVGSGPNRQYWAHRGEEFFQRSLGVAIHPGLWNYFNIR
jgi:hypothetical protein